MVQELGEQQQQRPAEGYFIGQDGQRNAVTDPVSPTVEERDNGTPVQHGPNDDRLAEQDEEHMSVDGSLSPSESHRSTTILTTSTAGDQSSVGGGSNIAGPSSNPHPGPGGANTGTSHNGPCPFVCSHPGCGARYGTSSKLGHHVRKHIPTAERPFVCQDCPDKRFLHRKDLTKHRQSLRHAQPEFRCHRCGAWFTRLDLLRRHQRDSCRQPEPP